MTDSDKDGTFFGVSDSISKELFLETYKDIAQIAQLLVAPLGVPYFIPVSQLIDEEKFTKLFLYAKIKALLKIYNSEMDKQEIETIADLFLSQYYYFSIQDFKLFLKMASTAQFGEVYGVLNIPTLFVWVNKYKSLRSDFIKNRELKL